MPTTDESGTPISDLYDLASNADWERHPDGGFVYKKKTHL
jgi:hypothetical protein